MGLWEYDFESCDVNYMYVCGVESYVSLMQVGSYVSSYVNLMQVESHILCKFVMIGSYIHVWILCKFGLLKYMWDMYMHMLVYVTLTFMSRSICKFTSLCLDPYACLHLYV